MKCWISLVAKAKLITWLSVVCCELKRFVVVFEFSHVPGTVLVLDTRTGMVHSVVAWYQVLVSISVGTVVLCCRQKNELGQTKITKYY